MLYIYCVYNKNKHTDDVTL